MALARPISACSAAAFHVDAAPDDFAGLADAFNGAAAEAEIHRRLALADRAGITRRRGAGAEPSRRFRTPTRNRRRYVFAVAHVVQGGLGIEAELRPDAVGDQGVEAGAFVHFVEVRQGLAFVQHAAVAGGGDRRPVHVVQQAFHQVGRRRRGPSSPADTECRSRRSRNRRRCAGRRCTSCTGPGSGRR